MNAPETVAPKAPDQWALMNQIDGALNNARVRAQAVLAIFDKGDFYDLSATGGADTYALISAAELLLNDIEEQAKTAMAAIEAAGQAQRAEVAHGSEALRAGATALQDLIRRLGDKAEADYIAAGLDGGDDERDYRAMSDMVQRDLAANLDHQSPEHRQGYLRALTDLLSIVADGAGPSEGWDPIKATAAAFARQPGANHG